VDTIDGNEVNVEMGHFQSGDYQTDPVWRKDLLYGPGDGLGNVEQMIPEIGWAIGPEIDFLSGHHQGVTRA
jgi:hypothetical protein